MLEVSSENVEQTNNLELGNNNTIIIVINTFICLRPELHETVNDYYETKTKKSDLETRLVSRP